jgi:hypothetical protein
VSGALRDLPALEARVRATLGAAVHLAAVRDGDVACVPPAHVANIADIADVAGVAGLAPRARDWRRGRAALTQLLARLGDPAPATGVRFPDPRLSLSHSGDWAIAAGCGAARGLGIDLEFARPMDPRAARFFLGDHERAFVDALAPARRSDALLRLWTVKEAVFKACAGNAGLLLADFRLDDPGARAGTARRIDGPAFAARYGSIDLGGGWLAVALADPGAAA